jgi:glucose-6-phosphate isomerase
MAINPPVDATGTAAWKKLQQHYDELQAQGIDLKQWFEDDPTRVDSLSFDVGTLRFDFSKNLIKPETLALFAELADEVNLKQRTKDMYSGVHINNTEDRAVLHTALRRPPSDEGKLIVDGQDVVKDVRETLDRMYAFADKVRSGEWKGVTGKRDRDRGQHRHRRLRPGPRHGVRGAEAVRRRRHQGPLHLEHRPERPAPRRPGPRPRDHAVHRRVEDLHHARDPDQRPHGPRLAARAARRPPAPSTAPTSRRPRPSPSTSSPSRPTWTRSPSSASTRPTRSASGTGSAAVTPSTPPSASARHRFGPARFEEFLAGFHAVDQHFAETPFEKNVPLLMGMLNVWYRQLLQGRLATPCCRTRSTCTASPAYLQQLTMESNGKSVRWDGTPVTTETGEIFWGEPGTNGQHAFYQLIHQGTQLIPADFIAFANTPHPTKDGDQDVHELFLATSSPRPRRWRSARPPTRCAPRALRKTSSRPACSPATADHVDHGPVRSDPVRCSAS